MAAKTYKNHGGRQEGVTTMKLEYTREFCCLGSVINTENRFHTYIKRIATAKQAF